MVEPGRAQMALWCMRIECWIIKATNTHLQYVIRTAFPLQQWLRERAPVLTFNVQYIACLVDSMWSLFCVMSRRYSNAHMGGSCSGCGMCDTTADRMTSDVGEIK
jgi:hypothetical protein